MNTRDVIMRICEMPSEFKKRGDVSMIQLLEESGYRQLREKVTEFHILPYIQTHPTVVEAWQCYSEDQRCRSGWFLQDKKVGFINALGQTASSQTYFNSKLDCSVYIKHMVNALCTRSSVTQRPRPQR